ncbi:MAG: hypothetical protein AB1391_04420 [Candidatus Micrarchaeota archaeon]
MEKVLVFLASSKLGEFSIHGLAQTIGMDKYRIYRAVSILEGMRILRMIRPYGRGAKFVRGDPKLMFYHPVMRKAICSNLRIEPDVGALREEIAVFFLTMRGWSIYTIKGAKKNPDYVIEMKKERMIIEVGGERKTHGQLKGFKEKTLVLTERQLIVLGCF